MWPETEVELERVQCELAERERMLPRWQPPVDRPLTVGAVFFATATGGVRTRASEPEPTWVTAVSVRGARTISSASLSGAVAPPYRAGYLALREGPLLERAVRSLDARPDVLLVNATGRDHPRGAGLALHLGAVLDIPSVGVTDRALLAGGGIPGPDRGDAEPLVLGGAVVGFVLRTRERARPVCVHAGWRTDASTARSVVLATCRGARTPEPLRLARYLARVARAEGEGRLPSGWRADAAPVVPRS